MRVGALEETITVRGEAPVVDVQNVKTQTVLTAFRAARMLGDYRGKSFCRYTIFPPSIVISTFIAPKCIAPAS
jgi:hypothetical protein